MRNEFGIKTLTDETLTDLKDNNEYNKMIKTCHNYEIMTNLKYSAAFQYTPVDMRDTLEEKENSDLVAKMLFLAYLSESQCKINSKTYI